MTFYMKNTISQEILFMLIVFSDSERCNECIGYAMMCVFFNFCMSVIQKYIVTINIYKRLKFKYLRNCILKWIIMILIYLVAIQKIVILKTLDIPPLLK